MQSLLGIDNGPRSKEEFIAQYKAMVDLVTSPDNVCAPSGNFDSHVSPTLKWELEFARKMKHIKEEEHWNADEYHFSYSLNFDSPSVEKAVEDIDTEHSGRQDHEFCADPYEQRIAMQCIDNGINTNDVDVDAITNGEVGKILWRIVKVGMPLKSKVDFWAELATKTRRAPSGFAQIAADAAASGDERLEMCAKRALECDLFERIVRRNVGNKAFDEMQKEMKEIANELSM